MAISLSSELIATAFQISDYLDASNLSYSIEEVEFLVIDIVNERLRSTVLRQSTSRIIQRAQSAELFSYSAEWIVNRGQFITDIKVFVVEYKRWKEHTERAKSGTVTSPRRDYSTGATSVHTSSASFRLPLKRGALYDPVDSLILLSIEKFNKVLDGASDFSDLSNSFRFNQYISTPLFIMSDDIDYQGIEFTEQQWNAF